MRKILIFLAISLVILLSGVIAVNQGGEGQVTPDLALTPNPNPLEFGQMSPGNSKSLSSSLTSGNSNLTVNLITVTSTSGNVFTEQNVMFSSNNQTFVKAENFDPINIPAQAMHSYFVQLTIPIGTQSSNFTGIITYTVMENLGQ